MLNNRIMTRFKKGTKVVCVDGFPAWRLLTGSIHTIGKDYNNGMLLIEGDIYIPLSSSRFIPVSEIEPFAVRHNTQYELNELREYGQKLGFKEGYKFRNVYPHYVYFNTKNNSPYYGVGTYDNIYYKTLTFEQFKNNEHIMKNQGTIEASFVLKVSPEFVKEAHKAACPEWKKKIESQFPSLFKFAKTATVHDNSYIINLLTGNRDVIDLTGEIVEIVSEPYEVAIYNGFTHTFRTVMYNGNPYRVLDCALRYA